MKEPLLSAFGDLAGPSTLAAVPVNYVATAEAKMPLFLARLVLDLLKAFLLDKTFGGKSIAHYSLVRGARLRLIFPKVDSLGEPRRDLVRTGDGTWFLVPAVSHQE